MLAILLVAFWLWGNPRLRGYAVYSFLSVGAVFVSGGLAAASVASQSPLAGLVERDDWWVSCSGCWSLPGGWARPRQRTRRRLEQP